ncbi:MAG: hypothetical protein KGL39_32445 [Patescibacteria group bacterium]|nr:hypothetical protein [Patescibacteria group bacterium]
MNRQAKAFIAVWFACAVMLELSGVAFGVHAGWIGLPGVSVGPMRVLLVDDVDRYRQPDFEPFRKAMDSTILQHYLTTHCIKDEKGNPEWRRFDKGADIENEAEWVKRLRSKRDTAGIVIESKGGRLYSGDPPGNLDATLSLVKRWGGE